MIPYPIPRLFAMAERLRVRVSWYPLECVSRADYIERGTARLIMLSPFLMHDHMRLRCTLAHELGHYHTGIGPDPGRDEARADRWAQELAVPDWWLIPRAHENLWELAEQAEVYQCWIEDRLRQLKYSLASGTSTGRRGAARLV